MQTSLPSTAIPSWTKSFSPATSSSQYLHKCRPVSKESSRLFQRSSVGSMNLAALIVAQSSPLAPLKRLAQPTSFQISVRSTATKKRFQLFFDTRERSLPRSVPHTFRCRTHIGQVASLDHWKTLPSVWDSGTKCSPWIPARPGLIYE